MARVTAPKEKPILPLPAAVVAHHAQVLEASQKEWLARKKIPPVLLLTGLNGVGKKSIVYHLSQWILCERSGFASQETEASLGLFGDAPAAPAGEPSTRPCGECNACVKALHGTWVEFTEIRPEEDDERGTLKVEQFRDLRAKMGFGSESGVARITLIPNADRMTPQAANSMLKLLEEPPRGWIFFLTASDPTLILPTVLSRCQAIRLQPLPKATLVGLLEEALVPKDRRDVVAELAQGSWGKALKLADNESWEKRDLLFRFLDDAPAQLTPLVEWASGSPLELDLLLNQLEHMLSELVLWSETGTPAADYPWKNRDGARPLATHAMKLVRARGSTGAAREFWVERAIRVGEIRRQSLAPLNRKILVQDLLVPWLK